MQDWRRAFLIESLRETLPEGQDLPALNRVPQNFQRVPVLHGNHLPGEVRVSTGPGQGREYQGNCDRLFFSCRHYAGTLRVCTLFADTGE